MSEKMYDVYLCPYNQPMAEKGKFMMRAPHWAVVTILQLHPDAIKRMVNETGAGKDCAMFPRQASHKGYMHIVREARGEFLNLGATPQ